MITVKKMDKVIEEYKDVFTKYAINYSDSSKLKIEDSEIKKGFEGFLNITAFLTQF